MSTPRQILGAPRARVEPVDDASGSRAAHRLEVHADVGGQSRALRWLTSLGVCWGLGLAVRARIGTAVAEILDNVVRHAYPNGHASARDERPRVVVLVARDANAVRVTVRDFGVGVEPHVLRAAIAPPPGLFALGVLPSGLRRATCLSDGLDAKSDAFGTRVHMRFETHGSAFTGAGTDHSDDDYLTARAARALVAAIRSGDDSGSQHLPPHLAVVVGRILAAAPGR
jgi:anti-sigma regulatory factor (Ser/Thr protein kinase)